MQLVAYREFRPHVESTPRMEAFYGKMGITESFLKDVHYSGPHEAVWAFAARRRVGRHFSQKLRRALADLKMQIEVEERAKRLNRIIEKLSRSDRSPGLEPGLPNRILEQLHLPSFDYPIGSVRDMYGVRLIIPPSPESRETCYLLLEKVLEVAGKKDASGILSMVDYLAYPEHRYGPGDNYLGRYESLQVSFIYLGVPIEVQIRDERMDWNAKNLVKRPGID